MESLKKKAGSFLASVSEMVSYLQETGRESAELQHILACAQGIDAALTAPKGAARKGKQSSAQVIGLVEEFQMLMQQLVDTGVLTRLQSQPLLAECQNIKEESSKLLLL